jgi:hypothetical protein
MSLCVYSVLATYGKKMYSLLLRSVSVSCIVYTYGKKMYSLLLRRFALHRELMFGWCMSCGIVYEYSV